MPVADGATTFPTYTVQVNDVCAFGMNRHTELLIFVLDESNLGLLQTSNSLRPRYGLRCQHRGVGAQKFCRIPKSCQAIEWNFFEFWLIINQSILNAIKRRLAPGCWNILDGCYSG